MTSTAGTPPLRIEELLRPEAFPHPVSRIELRETHISWVILTGPFAYKVKKPVQLEFIDASTLELRRHLCQEELRLNQRLAPQLYLGVEPITRAEGMVLVGGSGTAIEYAVRMRQFPAADEFHQLLAADGVPMGQVHALAELLADFHSRAAVADAAMIERGTRQVFEAVLGNLSQLITLVEQSEPATSLGWLGDWTRDCARALEDTFRSREQAGCIRECHGDLHTANIVRWENRLLPFDCIEFDPGLRWIDVIDDISFLVMDLVSRQRTDLAFVLLSRYLETTGDYEGVRLLRFYAVYRALVRAKVDAITAKALPQRAEEYRGRQRRRVAAAISWTKPHAPTMLLMHGASGSGKTWLSERLVPALAAIRVRSDLERKRLAGISARQSAAAGLHQGIYTQQFSHRTYGRLADCAETCLRAGFNVIVDAAFLEAADRELFRNLALRMRVSYVVVSCQADALSQAAHVLERVRTHSDASDADLSVLDEQLRTLQPFAPAERGHVVHVDARAANAIQRVLTAVSTLAGTPS